MTLDRFSQLADDFAFLDAWEERYGYIIDLGKQMPPLEDEFKVPATKVEGCASQVWLIIWTERSGLDHENRFHFKGDSDAIIVRGLIAILRILFDGLTVAEVARIDALERLQKLGLDSHLTPQRSNGLRAMVDRIQGKAADELSVVQPN